MRSYYSLLWSWVSIFVQGTYILFPSRKRWSMVFKILWNKAAASVFFGFSFGPSDSEKAVAAGCFHFALQLEIKATGSMEGGQFVTQFDSGLWCLRIPAYGKISLGYSKWKQLTVSPLTPHVWRKPSEPCWPHTDRPGQTLNKHHRLSSLRCSPCTVLRFSQGYENALESGGSVIQWLRIRIPDPNQLHAVPSYVTSGVLSHF